MITTTREAALKMIAQIEETAATRPEEPMYICGMLVSLSKTENLCENVADRIRLDLAMAAGGKGSCTPFSSCMRKRLRQHPDIDKGEVNVLILQPFALKHSWVNEARKNWLRIMYVDYQDN